MGRARGRFRGRDADGRAGPGFPAPGGVGHGPGRPGPGPGRSGGALASSAQGPWAWGRCPWGRRLAALRRDPSWPDAGELLGAGAGPLAVARPAAGVVRQAAGSVSPPERKGDRDPLLCAARAACRLWGARAPAVPGPLSRVGPGPAWRKGWAGAVPGPLPRRPGRAPPWRGSWPGRAGCGRWVPVVRVRAAPAGRAGRGRGRGVRGYCVVVAVTVHVPGGVSSRRRSKVKVMGLRWCGSPCRTCSLRRSTS